MEVDSLVRKDRFFKVHATVTAVLLCLSYCFLINARSSAPVVCVVLCKVYYI